MAKVHSKSSTITLSGEVSRVFPLFGPVEEQRWAEGWHPHILYAPSSDVAEHMVFQVDSHAEGPPMTTTWIVSKYDPEGLSLEYTVFTDSRIWWIAIVCEQGVRRDTTVATITYTYLGLTDQANELNEAALETMFRHDLEDWERAINHYLQTGTRWSPGHPDASDFK